MASGAAPGRMVPTQAQVSHQPAFVIQVDELRQDPAIRDRIVAHGWVPPRPAGSNRISGIGRQLYYKPGQGLTPFQIPRGLRSQDLIEPLTTWSLYHAGNTIFMTPCDAARQAVGNGSQSSRDDDSSDEDSDSDGGRDNDTDSDDSEQEQGTDWSRLMFKEAPLHLPGASFASYGQLHERLLEQHKDQQLWINELLPQRYHSARRYGDRRGQTQRGGLVGSFPLLVGLIALSGLQQEVEANLATVMQSGGWRAHGRRVDVSDKRGVVVRIWGVKGGRPSVTREQLTNELLAFEHGRWGKMYN